MKKCSINFQVEDLNDERKVLSAHFNGIPRTIIPYHYDVRLWTDFVSNRKVSLALLGQVTVCYFSFALTIRLFRCSFAASRLLLSFIFMDRI